MNDLLVAVDGGNAAILALLDQSAAFDTIDHSVLLDRLSARFGICGSALDWFSSYLANRSQSVHVFGVTSSPIFLTCGVPQGSVVGPVMFTLYNSPIHDIAVHHGISDQYYADDAQQHKTFKPTVDGVEQRIAYAALSNCIGETRQWMSANRMKFNESKTDALLVHGYHTPHEHPLMVGDVPIIPSKNVRNLGVIFDSRLTMEPQINSMCRRHIIICIVFRESGNFFLILRLFNLYMLLLHLLWIMGTPFLLVFLQNDLVNYKLCKIWLRG
jgi:hypothetical protein